MQNRLKAECMAVDGCDGCVPVTDYSMAALACNGQGKMGDGL